MMGLRVLKPGLLTTVQDGGRTGYRRYGVTPSGAMDPFALRVANLLVGNREDEAVLEITLLGPELRFEADTLIALGGGDLSPCIEGQPVPMGRPVWIRQGGILRFGKATEGCRSYLAFAVGIDLPAILGSRSTTIRHRLGGLEGRALKAGDRLGLRTPDTVPAWTADLPAQSPSEPFSAPNWFVSADIRPRYTANPMIRAMPGPQWDGFDEESQERFFHEPFEIMPQSDRMGYRLRGSNLKLEQSRELLSEAVTFGTVQVPADGNPILLMADHPTTGGYPEIAQVATIDLPLVAQAQPGERLRFREITVEEAQDALRQRERELKELKKGLELHGRR
jgi:antagonist of KipI